MLALVSIVAANQCSLQKNRIFSISLFCKVLRWIRRARDAEYLILYISHSGPQLEVDLPDRARPHRPRTADS